MAEGRREDEEETAGCEANVEEKVKAGPGTEADSTAAFYTLLQEQ